MSEYPVIVRWWARVWRWLETRPDWIAELGDDE
jgi:hypothetical protein